MQTGLHAVRHLSPFQSTPVPTAMRTAAFYGFHTGNAEKTPVFPSKNTGKQAF